MILTIFYMMALVIWLLLCIRRKAHSVGILLLCLYVAIAISSTLVMNKELLGNEKLLDLRFWPYLLLIMSYHLYFYPFLGKKSHLDSSKLKSPQSIIFSYFCYLYIFFSILTLLISVPSAINLAKSGNWADSYAQDSLRVDSNIVEYIAINFCSYFRILAIIVGFSLLREKKNRKKAVLAYFLISSAALTGITSAILSTSRSMIFSTIMIIISIYIFYNKNIAKNRKRFIGTFFVIVLIITASLFVDISVSRFASRSIEDELLSYSGQAPIVFNAQLATKIDRYMFGQYAFGRIFDNSSFTPRMIGGTWDTRFYTFIGWIFIDWGPVGVLLLGLIAKLYFSNIVNRPKYNISDVYLLFSYYSFLQRGVFVIGRNEWYMIVSTIMIYLFLKYIAERISGYSG